MNQYQIGTTSGIKGITLETGTSSRASTETQRGTTKDQAEVQQSQPNFTENRRLEHLAQGTTTDWKHKVDTQTLWIQGPWNTGETILYAGSHTGGKHNRAGDEESEMSFKTKQKIIYFFLLFFLNQH